MYAVESESGQHIMYVVKCGQKVDRKWIENVNRNLLAKCYE